MNRTDLINGLEWLICDFDKINVKAYLEIIVNELKMKKEVCFNCGKPKSEHTYLFEVDNEEILLCPKWW